MTSTRIEELMKQTAYPESDSVYQAMNQVWNEMQQDFNSRVCMNCVYNTPSEMCNKFIKRPPTSQVSKFGCTEFERYSK